MHELVESKERKIWRGCKALKLHAIKLTSTQHAAY